MMGGVVKWDDRRLPGDWSGCVGAYLNLSAPAKVLAFSRSTAFSHSTLPGTPMAPLESGTYSIINAKFHDVAVLPDDNLNSDIVGMPEENGLRGAWCVSRLLNGKYIIKNQAYGHYAGSVPGAAQGDFVYGGERAKQLTIRETRLKGRYTISPVDADLFWGLSDCETHTPITLSIVASDPKNHWTFARIVETPPMSAPDPSSGDSVLGRDVGNSSQRSLRLLAFDGGGIRGLSSLFILQDIMEEICRDQNLVETPHPCEFFDLIGGTGTGGLIAILLGRLRMSVSDAIAVYLSSAREVFTTSIFHYFGRNTFDHKRLEASLKDAVRDRTNDANSPMKDPRESRCCRTFVLALPKHNLVLGPTLLRTYAASHANPAVCTIWQAGRATTAAPSFFESVSVPMAVGGVHANLVDAGLGYNNPSQQVLEEARRIWGEERQVGCLLSIGTGRPGVVDLSGTTRPSVLLRAANAYTAIASDCEATHQDVLKHIDSSQYPPPNSYFRFNVDQGMQDVGLEWETQAGVVAHTASYMRENGVAGKMSQCARRLGEITNEITSSLSL